MGSTPSARQSELLERAYQYALEHGLTDMSLRPLATAIGSSPRVLLFLFDSKDGLIRALLGRARADELDLLDRVHARDDVLVLQGQNSLIVDKAAGRGHDAVPLPGHRRRWETR